MDQLKSGNIYIFPLSKVRNLKGLWLPTLVTIKKKGRRPRPIYIFSWSGFNTKVKQASPKEAMRFRRSLHRLLY